MISRYQDNCKVCANYLGNQCCEAFLEGIPEALWSGEHLHREHYQGDNGILFKAKQMIMPDAEAFLSDKY